MAKKVPENSAEPGFGVSRRKFLADAGIVIGGAAALATLTACNSNNTSESTFPISGASSAGLSLAAEQYGFFAKVSKCTSCLKCVEACVEVSGTPGYEEPRRKIASCTNNNGEEYYVPTSCMHCAVPACEPVCPAGAISKVEGGIVVVDHNRCIGCKYCYQACPFAVPNYPPQGMDKCDYCLGNNVPLEEQKNCVKACKFDALHYGLVTDFESMVSGELVQVGGSTGPSLYLSYE